MKTHLVLTLITATFLASCAAPVNVTSTRSSRFTAGRQNQGGTVCLLTSGTVVDSMGGASTTDLGDIGVTQTAAVSQRMQRVGMSMAGSPLTADYGMSLFMSQASSNNKLELNMKAEFMEMQGGLPGPVLWRGTAKTTTSDTARTAGESAMVKSLMSKFPN